MAAGEYVSMRAQSELLEREIEMERIELRRSPEQERQELAQLYRSRGIDPGVADEMADELMRTPELALQTHTREELGVNPNDLGSPYKAASASATSFAAGALVPLVPWFVTQGTAAIVASLVLGALAALAIGFALARFTGRSVLRSMFRQLSVTVLAAGVTFAIGKAVGHQVT
jgi:VIT1/CCC1 family predicted Fe2+/Mn2+ transporter